VSVSSLKVASRNDERHATLIADPDSDGLGALTCSPKLEACQPGSLTSKKVCPEGESTEPEPGTFVPPYQDILNGSRTFNTTYPERRDFRSCRFQVPQDPLPTNWAATCVRNMKKVGFLHEVKARPNEECPAGWFLCKGMCYVSPPSLHLLLRVICARL